MTFFIPILISHSSLPPTTHPTPKIQSFYKDPTCLKLRHLPHIFNCVLELPFCSNIDVAIEEALDCFRFTTETNDIGNGGAHAVEIFYNVCGAVTMTEAGSVQASFIDLDSDGGARMGGGPLVVGQRRLG